MRSFLTVLGFSVLAACSPEGQESPQSLLDGYTVVGDLPADADVDQLVAEMGDAQYRLVGDPVSGEMGLLVKEGSAFARIANNDFSVAGGPVCLDCGGACTSGVSTRTLEIDITHDAGWAAEEFITSTVNHQNFNGVTVAPAGKWSAPLGNTVTLDFTGTIQNCNQGFNYDFDVLGEQRVFVTSTTYNGNLGGSAGADSKCAARASAAGLTGSYKAWISTTAEAASAHTTQYGTSYVLTTGLDISTSYADLTDGTILRRIDRNEFGAAVAASNVWTGTTGAGAGTNNYCTNAGADWTSSAGTKYGTVGRTDRTTAGWTSYVTQRACNVSARLYCVEQ